MSLRISSFILSMINKTKLFYFIILLISYVWHFICFHPTHASILLQNNITILNVTQDRYVVYQVVLEFHKNPVTIILNTRKFHPKNPESIRYIIKHLLCIQFKNYLFKSQSSSKCNKTFFGILHDHYRRHEGTNVKKKKNFISI